MYSSTARARWSGQIRAARSGGAGPGDVVLALIDPVSAAAGDLTDPDAGEGAVGDQRVPGRLDAAVCSASSASSVVWVRTRSRSAGSAGPVSSPVLVGWLRPGRRAEPF